MPSHQLFSFFSFALSKMLEWLSLFSLAAMSLVTLTRQSVVNRLFIIFLLKSLWVKCVMKMMRDRNEHYRRKNVSYNRNAPNCNLILKVIKNALNHWKWPKWFQRKNTINCNKIKFNVQTPVNVNSKAITLKLVWFRC